MQYLSPFILAVSLLTTVQAFSSFQNIIPNGNNVDHPCKVNYRWPGLGHENPMGGGARNSFGVDFNRLGNQWSEELCRMDSDGDGRTNGEELGDPDCTWTPGQTPPSVTGLSHPGVCEPVDSPQCQGKVDFVDCNVEQFGDCDVIQGPDVQTIDLKFPRTQVPDSETNYFCMTFDMPADQDYHMVAYEPLVDNANVLHHILLYGCTDPNGQRISSPELCFMSGENNDCNDIISTWTVGISGFCLPENLGFQFGKSGYTRFRLETHYNNPALRPDYTDASGLRLYYTPSTPQMVSMMTFMTGQVDLEIPPGKARVEAVGVCPSDCTRTLIIEPANVYLAFNHMHYLGRSMKIEVFREGRLATTLTNDEYYSYDSPVNHIQSPAFQLLPGDEIRTTCVFNSLSSNRWVYYGEGTNDEMCFGFLTIYPRSALVTGGGACISNGPLSPCDMYWKRPKQDCDWPTFTNRSHPDTKKWWDRVDKDCSLTGRCRPECAKIAAQVKSQPCMQGEMSRVVQDMLEETHQGTALLGKLHSCNNNDMGTCTADQCSQYMEGVGEYVSDGAASLTGVSLITGLGIAATLVTCWTQRNL